jgi:hypothetical protein
MKLETVQSPTYDVNYVIVHVQSTDLDCQAILNSRLQIDAQTTLKISLVEPIFGSEAAIRWSHKVKVSLNDSGKWIDSSQRVGIL